MILVLVVATSLLPPLLWLLFFRAQDLYAPEPFSLVLRIFLWGMLAGPWAAGVNALLLEHAGPDLLDAAIDHAGKGTACTLLGLLVFLAALNEEAIKYVVVSSATRADPRFSEPVDGMIYMVAGALGFAASENLLYTGRAYLDPSVADGTVQAFWVVAPLRAIVSTISHAAWSGLLGYFYSKQALRGAGDRVLWAGIFLAAVLHTAYDLPAFGLAPSWLLGPVWVASVAAYSHLFGRALLASAGARRQPEAGPSGVPRQAGTGTMRRFEGRSRRETLSAALLALVFFLATAAALRRGLSLEEIVPLCLGIVIAAVTIFWLNRRCPRCYHHLGVALRPSTCGGCGTRFGTATPPGNPADTKPIVRCD